MLFTQVSSTFLKYRRGNRVWRGGVSNYRWNARKDMEKERRQNITRRFERRRYFNFISIFSNGRTLKGRKIRSKINDHRNNFSFVLRITKNCPIWIMTQDLLIQHLFEEDMKIKDNM